MESSQLQRQWKQFSNKNLKKLRKYDVTKEKKVEFD